MTRKRCNLPKLFKLQRMKVRASLSNSGDMAEVENCDDLLTFVSYNKARFYWPNLTKNFF